MVSVPVQPEVHLRFPTTEAQIVDGTKKLMDDSKATYDKIAAVPLEEVSIDNVFELHRNLLRDKGIEGSRIDFVQHVSPSKELRDCAVAQDKIISEFDVEQGMRKDVFDRFAALLEKLPKDCCPEVEQK